MAARRRVSLVGRAAEVGDVRIRPARGLAAPRYDPAWESEGVPRLRKSTFLLTINPNLKPRDQDQANDISMRLMDACADLLENDEWKRSIIEILDGAPTDMVDYDGIKAHFVVELGHGKFGGRIHAHGFFSVEHYSKIHLRPDVIKQLILGRLNDPNIDPVIPHVKNVYVNVKYVGNSRSVKEYIKKTKSWKVTPIKEYIRTRLGYEPDIDLEEMGRGILEDEE